MKVIKPSKLLLLLVNGVMGGEVIACKWWFFYVNFDFIDEPLYHVFVIVAFHAGDVKGRSSNLISSVRDDTVVCGLLRRRRRKALSKSIRPIPLQPQVPLIQRVPYIRKEEVHSLKAIERFQRRQIECRVYLDHLHRLQLIGR